MTVVIGVDGSACSLTALHWAAREATNRGTLLRVVVVQPPIPEWPHDAPEHVAQLRASIEAHTDEVLAAAAGVLAEFPGISTGTEVRDGSPAAELLDVAAGAELLVVGSRGLGPVRGVLSGSTSGQLAGHTPCPLVVVRDEPASASGVIVVGVDGPASEPAVEFAFGHARRWNATVRPVWCYSHPLMFTAGAGMGFLDDDLGPGYERELAAVLAPVRERHPDVAVQPVVTLGRAVEILAAEAAGADLLVVGSRGRGGFRSLVLGSVALSVLHDVRRPVAVVPAAE